MISPFQLRSYLTYWLDAVDQHSLHSPFFYDLYTKVIKIDMSNSSFDRIELLREKLLRNPTPLAITDIGAGSKHFKGGARLIKDIARTSLSPARYSRLYHRLATYFGCKNILELGTSLGINALYLAATPGSLVTTMEGVPAIASVARSTFEFADVTSIKIIEGDIDETLPSFLSRSATLDLVVIDANHRYEPTIRYFNQFLSRISENTILVFDDIHYTKEMEKAWNEIRNHPLVYGTADIYRSGIVFFDPSLNKQHVVLQF
jgi:predicted O-methyltransferase YrrM